MLCNIALYNFPSVHFTGHYSCHLALMNFNPYLTFNLITIYITDDTMSMTTSKAHTMGYLMALGSSIFYSLLSMAIAICEDTHWSIWILLTGSSQIIFSIFLLAFLRSGSGGGGKSIPTWGKKKPPTKTRSKCTLGRKKMYSYNAHLVVIRVGRQAGR